MATFSRGEYWRRRLAHWPAAQPGGECAGYSLLLPVPGDLPVFLELALEVCRRQSADERVTTVVIPDRMTPQMEAIVANHRPSWVGPLELIPLPCPERWFLHHLQSGSRNHGMQLVAGVAAASSSHIVLHDADLFILREDFLDEQYRRCRDHNLACLGVSPVWDPWYAEHGLDLAATWEMVAEVSWLRSFSRYAHLGHDDVLFGESHTFDTTLYPQAVTDKRKIGRTERNADFVHFNYVISTYRDFQRNRYGFVDSDFRLLLIALFVALFSGAHGGAADVPKLEELASGLDGAGGPVIYPPRTEVGGKYIEFRTRLDRALTGAYVSQHNVTRAQAALQPFDRYYGFGEPTASARTRSK